jgi:hypothetical protein
MDRRTRSRAANRVQGTICGAEPSHGDTGRRDATVMERHWRPVLGHSQVPAHVREYFARLCPDCLRAIAKVTP